MLFGPGWIITVSTFSVTTEQAEAVVLVPDVRSIVIEEYKSINYELAIMDFSNSPPNPPPGPPGAAYFSIGISALKDQLPEDEIKAATETGLTKAIHKIVPGARVILDMKLKQVIPV